MVSGKSTVTTTIQASSMMYIMVKPVNLYEPLNSK